MKISSAVPPLAGDSMGWLIQVSPAVNRHTDQHVFLDLLVCTTDFPSQVSLGQKKKYVGFRFRDPT
jgi:hypothetical protein